MGGPTCQNGACTGTPLTCSGGKICQGGACVCPAGHVFCANTGTCINSVSGCAAAGCNACGYDAACDGTVVYDPTVGYQTTCKSSLGSCDASNAQSSYGADQLEYHGGATYACLKLDGTYGWQKVVVSASAGGPGCLSAFMQCDYLCSAALSYSVFCDSQNDWDPILMQAGLYGCPQLVPLPASYACP
jgi:hypothetical protein